MALPLGWSWKCGQITYDPVLINNHHPAPAAGSGLAGDAGHLLHPQTSEAGACAMTSAHFPTEQAEVGPPVCERWEASRSRTVCDPRLRQAADPTGRGPPSQRAGTSSGAQRMGAGGAGAPGGSPHTTPTLGTVPEQRLPRKTSQVTPARDFQTTGLMTQWCRQPAFT